MTHPRRSQYLARRGAEAEPTDENPQVVSDVASQRLICQRTFRNRHKAAHQQLVIERDLGDDRARLREQVASTRTEIAPLSRDIHEEIDAILRTAEQPLPGESIVGSDFATLVHLLWHTGCRIGEALAL